MATSVGNPQRQFGVGNEREGEHHRQGGHEDQQEHADRRQPVVSRQSSALGRDLGQPTQSHAQRLELFLTQQGGEKWRQRIGDDLSCLGGPALITRTAQGCECPPAVAELRHQIHYPVDDAPRQIAAERAGDQRPDIGFTVLPQSRSNS